MAAMLRNIAATVAGIVSALLLLIATEGLSAVVHPFPEGFGHTKEEICAHVAKYPGWVLAAVVPMWGVTAFLSVWVTGRIGHLISSTLVGVLFLGAIVANVLMLPYPAWFSIASPLAVAVGVVAALILNSRRKL